MIFNRPYHRSIGVPDSGSCARRNRFDGAARVAVTQAGEFCGFDMATNIYVGNLPWQTTSDDLYALFSEFGQVLKAQIISDRETGRSRGFGFVEMAQESEANAAIQALNNNPYNGRPLTVNIAKPRESRPAGGGRGYGAGGSRGYGGGRGGYDHGGYEGGERY